MASDQAGAPGKQVFAEGVVKESGHLLYRATGIVLRAVTTLAPIVYHVVVVALSAGIALSLPSIVSFVARHFLLYWSLIENEKIFLIGAEIAVAVLLILFFHYVGRSWRDRKLSRMARGAGMVYFSPRRGFLARWRIRRWKKRQGLARDIMVVGSTGFRTFVDPKGDLHKVIKNCREAKIMLLNPYSEGARTRAQAILHPGVTLESFREQIIKSVDFLRALKRVQKNVKLKLYQDPPFLKLAVLGDHIWMQHYHAGLDVLHMPEYMFAHDQDGGSLYTPLYQYFLMRWEDPDLPEYNLETDELIYRDKDRNEVRREKFNGVGIEDEP
jgi:hypothetical protein